MTRQFKFLIGAIIIGVLLIGISMLMENTSIEKTEISNNDMGTNFTPLENKVKTLANQNYNPSDFITLNAEIHSSYSNQLITKAGEENLKLQLKETQSKVLFSECESYLYGSSSDDSELLQWLTDFNKSYPNESKTSYYKAQINAYVYYSTTLPNKINAFVKKQCFDDVKSNNLISEVQNLSRLDTKYKRKIKHRIEPLIGKIKDYRSESSEKYEPCEEINEIDQSKI